MVYKPMTIRLGIIGCGRVAEERHLPALQMLKDVQVVAVADIDLRSTAADAKTDLRMNWHIRRRLIYLTYTRG